ncbi:MAG: hypothetical protein ACD_37C00012G0008 [uncultured bacterium]|nr:MAG: hypothetical protein ACD_37C00012G0008 [uncultured bacterium]
MQSLHPCDLIYHYIYSVNNIVLTTNFAEKHTLSYYFVGICPNKTDMSLFNSLSVPFEFNCLIDLITLTLPILAFITLLLLITAVVLAFIKLSILIFSKKSDYCVLEITPPAFSEQSAYATAQLINSISSLIKQSNLVSKVFDISRSISLEINSTKTDGIRYLIHLSSEDASVIEKNITAFLPGTQIKTIEDYAPIYSRRINIIKFTLSKDFIYSLKELDNLKEYDPISYITASMTKLQADELVSLQLIISPVARTTNQKIAKIKSSLLDDKDIIGKSYNEFSIWHFLIKILLLPLGTAIFILSEGKDGPIIKADRKNKCYPDTNYKNLLESQIRAKIDQNLYNVSFRILINSEKFETIRKIFKGFLSSLAPFSNSSYQFIKAKYFPKFRIIQKVFYFQFIYRLHDFRNNLILSTSELADLYHLPFDRSTKTENIAKTHFKALPAPISLKKAKYIDIKFAKNIFNDTETDIGLTKEERRRHVYILGATGTGKSTMLLSMIKQDIEHNKGICVVDPHGDLIDQILSIIPEERIKDTIYFNPDDISYPIGINLLELSHGLSSEDTIREKEFIAESIISVFHKIYTDKYSGPRMEYILRNAIYTAFTVSDATLFTIYKLLINTSFRKSIVRNLTDENLLDFWKYEFAKAGDYQKVKMISPITNKIGRFLFSSTAKRILEQPRSTINFDSIMNDEKILLCNLSKGKIGEDNSSVFGELIMAKIQLAALKRARMNPEDRKDFYLYVDEFQNFATPAFAQILSEARKYKLNAILAHQTTSQLEESSLVNVTLANTGTIICFRTANPEDERVILPQFRPYIEQGDIANLPSYNFYMKLGAINPEEPFSGQTITTNIGYKQITIDKVIDSSRNTYATKWKPNQLVKINSKTNTINTDLPKNENNVLLP